jgi:hypothetical protein
MTGATAKRSVPFGLVGLLLAAAPFLSGGSARADAPLSYNASASADPVRVLTTIANFPATKSPVDSGGPSAQVTLSTTTGGTAYSAAPDPGSFFTSLPTIGAGVAAQNGLDFPFNVPPYPFAIRADDQQPSQSVGAGGYELNADVAPSSALARTQAGAQSPGGNVVLTVANAGITSTAEGVKAEAISDIQTLTIGPLTLGGIRSVASVISDQTGALTRTSSFSVDAARIGTLPVGLAPGGFTVAGQPVPAADQKTFNDTLAASGISLTQFPAQQTTTGVVGAGLVLTQKFESPQFGATQIAYRIGGVAVSLQAAGAPTGIGGGVSTAPGGQPAATAPLPGAALGTIDPGSMTPAIAPAGTTPSAGVPADAPAEVRTVQMLPANVALPAAPDGNLLYLAIVIAGLLGLGVTRLLRATG